MRISKYELGYLKGSFYVNTEEPKANIIITHGLATNKDWGFIPYVAESLSKMYNVWTFDLPNCSVGEDLNELKKMNNFTFSDNINDLSYIIKALSKNNSVTNNIYFDNTLPKFLLGHSIGATINLLYTISNPEEIKGNICWNGIPTVEFLGTQHIENIRNTGETKVYLPTRSTQIPFGQSIVKDIDNNSIKFNLPYLLGKNSILPIKFIQSKEDNAYLVKFVSDLIKSNSYLEYDEIPFANHNFTKDNAILQEAQLNIAIDSTMAFINKLR